MTFRGPQAPQIGDVIAGKYRLVRRIGRGGMGIVYAAQHEGAGREVAIKLLHSGAGGRDATVRMLNEARASSRIQGEHVVRVLDVGLFGDARESPDAHKPFLVMELLEGEDLGARVRRVGRLPYAQVTDLLLEAMDALGQAHALGIVHRDLKPTNLFIAQREGGGELLKVLDFGVAKLFEADNENLTRTNDFVGSPVYISPEQFKNAREVTPLADLWSLGVIGYELLAGEPPFKGAALPQLLAAVLSAPIVGIDLLQPEVPRGLADAVGWALERDLTKRVSSCSELAAALRPYASPRGVAVANRLMGIGVSRPPLAPATTEPNRSPPPASFTPPALAGPFPSPSFAPSQSLAPSPYVTPPPSGATGGLSAFESPDRVSLGRGSQLKVVALSFGAVATLGGIGIALAVARTPAGDLPRRDPPAALGAVAASVAPAVPVAGTAAAPVDPPTVDSAPPVDSAARVEASATAAADPTATGSGVTRPLQAANDATRTIEPRPSRPSPPRLAPPAPSASGSSGIVTSKDWF